MDQYLISQLQPRTHIPAIDNGLITLQQLTYIQFCMMPHLFDIYIDKLIHQQKYKTIGDIFILYTNTLLQLVPISRDIKNVQLQYFQASAIGNQMVKLLKSIVYKMPVDFKELLFHYQLAPFFYNMFWRSIGREAKHKYELMHSVSGDNNNNNNNSNNTQITKNNNNNNNNNSHNTTHNNNNNNNAHGSSQKDYVTYMNSLQTYFTMLAIECDLTKNKKITNLNEKNDKMKQIDKYNKSTLGNVRVSSPIYAKYCDKFNKLLDKLMYVFYLPDTKDTIKDKDKDRINKQAQNKHKQIKQQQQQQPIPSSSLSSSQQLPLNKIHLCPFYQKCISLKQKQQLIKYQFDICIKTGKNSLKKLKQIQLMCLLFLEQYKASKIRSKLQVYLLLMAIKIYKNNSVEGILEQLKLLYSFDRVPLIDYCYFILYAIIGIQQPEQQTQTQTQQSSSVSSLQSTQIKHIKQIIDYILKTYSKIHGNDQKYIKLAVMSSLYLYHQSGNIRSINRKQLLEKICKYEDIILYINSVDMLDYILQLVWIGKEVRVMGRRGDTEEKGKKGKSVRHDSTKMIDENTNNLKDHPLQFLFSYRDGQAQLRQTIMKTSIQIDNPTTTPPASTSSQQPQLSYQKLLPILQKILYKGQQLLNTAIKQSSSYNSTYMQYFTIKLLQILLYTHHGCKFTRQSLKLILRTIQQYCTISTFYSIQQKLIKVLFALLYFNLNASDVDIDSNDNEQDMGEYMNVNVHDSSNVLEQLVCLQLFMGKINYEKVELYLKNNSDKFVAMHHDLFKCILNYELVEMLAENYRGHYDKYMVEWLQNDENYLYNWPDTRREKVLLAKRLRFISYLKNKFKIA